MLLGDCFPCGTPEGGTGGRPRPPPPPSPPPDEAMASLLVNPAACGTLLAGDEGPSPPLPPLPLLSVGGAFSSSLLEWMGKEREKVLLQKFQENEN